MATTIIQYTLRPEGEQEGGFFTLLPVLPCLEVFTYSKKNLKYQKQIWQPYKS